jgi:ribose transport system ATP-binding protein/inositol transport system ATP-binding protein
MNMEDNVKVNYIEMRDICKSFYNVHALKNVDFSIQKGETHALLGENGAGKSTLIRILGGVYSADKGEIYMEGKPVSIDSISSAASMGISIIHQELCLAENMLVSENIFMGRENKKKDSPFIDRRFLNRRTKEILGYLQVDFKPDDFVGDLSIANRQMVEIAKVLSFNNRVIIMDEPTSSLSAKEVKALFRIIKDLKQRGISIIYISHRLEELYSIADRVTVLRDGARISTYNMNNISQKDLITAMVGRQLDEFYFKQKNVQEQVAIEVKNLNEKNVLSDINFYVRKGEILGFAGLVGAGRTEIARAIFGIDNAVTKEIYVNGEKCVIHSPVDAFRHGIYLVPEDRKREGLFLDNRLQFNITISSLKDFFNRLIGFNSKKEREMIQKSITLLSIKTDGIDQLVKNLSGGNQQKTVIAKILLSKPKILILDEPTRGIDVGAKAEIYSLMNKLTNEGVAIIMISSELPEIVNMSDRVIVVSGGRIAATLEGSDIEQEKIMYYATGGN